MKIVKKYVLSEKTLEKDIDKFMMEAKKGAYQFDYKYGQEGLKLMKAYFRFIEQEMKNSNYENAIICYEKLLHVLFDSEYDYFNYEDIVGKFNTEKIISNYFYSIIQAKKDVFVKYLEYLKLIEGYYFESAHTTILTNLSDSELIIFFEKVEEKIKSLKEEDYHYHELIDMFLKYLKDKNFSKYTEVKEKYKDWIEDE